jgi:DNA-binding PucR family transcriptional regulator
LERLKVPLTFLGETGVVLLRGPAPESPERVRDALLQYLAPAPLWLAHGAGYDSFAGLREALRGAVSSVEEARREGGRHVLKVGGAGGLDGLLENPKLSDDLRAFAQEALGPLEDYDAAGGKRLTETFCHALALGSTAQAARLLFVHENTVRYRVRRAEEILGKSLASPKERTAMTLAALVWLRRRSSGEAPDGVQAT